MGVDIWKHLPLDFYTRFSGPAATPLTYTTAAFKQPDGKVLYIHAQRWATVHILAPRCNRWVVADVPSIEHRLQNVSAVVSYKFYILYGIWLIPSGKPPSRPPANRARLVTSL